MEVFWVERRDTGMVVALIVPIEETGRKRGTIPP